MLILYYSESITWQRDVCHERNKGVFGINSKNVLEREFKGKGKDNGNTFFKILIYLFQYYSPSHKSIEKNPFMSKVFSTLQTTKISWQHF